MFDRKEKVTYVELRARIEKGHGAWLIFNNPDHMKTYFKQFNPVSINRLLADEEKHHARLAELDSFLKANGYKEVFRTMLDNIIGTSINDPEELKIFYSGLATNAAAYSKDSHESVSKYYAENPEYAIVRLLETLTFKK